MLFTEFINQAWNDHATDAPSVAQRFDGALDMLKTPEDVTKLAHLISHVMGEHLGQFDSGSEWVTRLADLPCNDTNSRQSLHIYNKSMKYASGHSEAFDGLPIADQARGLAIAAGALVDLDINRAEASLLRAVKLSAELAPTEAAVRSIAATSNNLACKLEEKTNRTAYETELMLKAAHLAREFWTKAGTWIHIERAEYRLAESYRRAGQLEKAKYHASECLRICRANEADADELKYAEDIVKSIDQALVEATH